MSNIFLTKVRLSFPTLVEPRVVGNNPNGKAKYSADFIMEPSHPDFANFMTEVRRLATEKWRENAGNVLTMIGTDRKLRCYGRGDERVDKKTFKPYLGYAGNVYISASRDFAPQMIQLDGSPVDSNNTMAYQAIARSLYGGCYVNVALRPWLQENEHGRGVRCDLAGIQFAADGEAFGEGDIDVSGMFAPVATAPAAPTPPWGMPTPPFANQ